MSRRYNPQARHQARKTALQALYQWQLAGQDLINIQQQFLGEMDVKNVDVDYFSELLMGVPKNVDEIDANITPALDRPITELDPVELAIMRISVYELLNRTDVPYKVVINEAVELAKTFGATDGYKYVNGVLDKIIKNVE